MQGDVLKFREKVQVRVRKEPKPQDLGIFHSKTLDFGPFTPP